MKKLRIIVSGKVYDVEVQVLEDDEAGGYPANPSYQGTAAAPAVRSGPAPNAPPAPTMPPVTAGAGDANVIAAPIAGTVQ